MRKSEFDRAMAAEFGAAHAAVLNYDLVLPKPLGVTPREALLAGVPARDVWLAVCRMMDVPPERRVGAGKLEPKR